MKKTFRKDDYISKALLLMSVIDENIARIFLTATPLKENVEASIDLTSFTKRIDILSSLIDKVSLENSCDSDVDIGYFLNEAIWSLKNCTSYLKMLKPQDRSVTNALVVLNTKEVLLLLLKYQEALVRIIKHLKVFD